MLAIVFNNATWLQLYALYRHPTAASRPTPCGIVTGLSHPDFQILKWSQKDIDATSEKARTLGAPLTKGHALYKGLQQKYMPSTTS